MRTRSPSLLLGEEVLATSLAARQQDATAALEVARRADRDGTPRSWLHAAGLDMDELRPTVLDRIVLIVVRIGVLLHLERKGQVAPRSAVHRVHRPTEARKGEMHEVASFEDGIKQLHRQ